MTPKTIIENPTPPIDDTALRQLFAKSGIKNTRQRQLLYAHLAQSPDPLTADQLYQVLSQGDQSMNLSTIYRILETFVDKRLIEKSFTSLDNKAAYTIYIAEHRHYLICTSCRKIEPLTCCPLAAFEKELAEKMNYSITGHKLEIYGVCSACVRS